MATNRPLDPTSNFQLDNVPPPMPIWVAHNPTKEKPPVIPPTRNLSTYKDRPAAMFYDDEIQILAHPFSHSLVGKFTRMPKLQDIQQAFRGIGLLREYEIRWMDYKHVLIHLSNEQDFNHLWVKEQWFILNQKMRVFKWTPDFEAEKELALVPVWISFPNLRAHLYEKSALMLIAKTVGKPLYVDEATTNGSRSSVARVYVEFQTISGDGEKAQNRIEKQGQTKHMNSNHAGQNIFLGMSLGSSDRGENAAVEIGETYAVRRTSNNASNDDQQQQIMHEKKKEIITAQNEARLDGVEKATIIAAKTSPMEDPVQVHEVQEHNGINNSVKEMELTELMSAEMEVHPLVRHRRHSDTAATLGKIISLALEEIVDIGENDGIFDDDSISAIVLDYGLVDGGFEGNLYTWTNNHMFQRLDRVVYNHHWLNFLPITWVQHLNRDGSDHCPLLISCLRQTEKSPSSFHFLHAWVHHHGFKQCVEANWQQPIQGKGFIAFWQKQLRLKQHLKWWNKQFDFCSQWIGMIKRCIANCWFSVSINGKAAGYFKFERRLR
ncbi:Uncharacterized protein TCM_039863 [Theobroma cacao]|uniref:DUF4283 domain-containing protein n=1 Tax=Theobroma cacao TaxID=3641 RepID=A0A061GQZ2_THECC|nr:Uncharacterized protein TCM_039863 [Theobroma cacao]